MTPGLPGVCSGAAALGIEMVVCSTRGQAQSLVLGDQVEAEAHALPPEPGIDFLETAPELAEAGVREVMVRLPDLTGPAPVARFGEVIAAFR